MCLPSVLGRATQRSLSEITTRRRRQMRSVLFALALLVASVAQAQTCPTPAQLVTDLNAATQAQLISLSGVNPLNCPEVGMSHTWDGGKLIFSDSPETVTARGKLYEDTTLSYTSGTVYNR